MRTTTILALACISVCISGISQLNAQTLKTFNQNASGVNHTGISFSITPFISSPLKKNSDSLLFRGMGNGLKMDVDYFVGHFGIGMSSGFGSATVDDASINNFIRNSGTVIDLPVITKTSQQNGFLLLGPSVRVGEQIEFEAHAKGGMFMNTAPVVSIQQRGATKIIYRNEPTDKNVSLGFMTGMKTKYTGKSESWSIGLSVDYLNTSTEVNNYDARRNGGVEPLKLSKNISDIVAGLSISYNLNNAGTRRTGRPGKTKFNNLSLRTGNNAEGQQVASTTASSTNIDRPISNQSANSSGQSCGPVKQTINNPDGTVTIMEFSCPNDAASYFQQVKQMPAADKQTQNSSFGEKVNAGRSLNKENLVHRDLAARTVISGQLAWSTADNGGITTNKTKGSRQTKGATFGEKVKMVVRETTPGSEAKEKKYGMLLAEGGNIPVSADATVHENPVFTGEVGEHQNVLASNRQMGGENPFYEATPKNQQLKENPLYGGSGQSGQNPMHESKLSNINNNPLYQERSKAMGIEKVLIELVDQENGATIATTETEPGGEFYFAEIPDGDYSIKINRTLTNKRSYDVNAKTTIDLIGMIEQGNETVQLLLNIERVPDSMQQRAGISTSRSNMRRTLQLLDPSVSEGNSAEGGNANRPGTPIGGIIVKGGKNPGGQMRTVNTDGNGIFEFKSLEAGQYLIQMERIFKVNEEVEFRIQQVPMETAPEGKSIKERSTKGMKDTIKTQV